MDISRLTRGERILGISALLLLILSIFPLWAKYEVSGGDLGFGIEIPDASQRYSAWSAATPFTIKLALVFALLALILVAIRAAGTNVNLPVAPSMLYLTFAGAAAGLLLIGVIMGPEGNDLSFGGFEISRGPLMFAGLLLGLAMAAGAWLHQQEEGSTAVTPMAGGPPMVPPPGPPPPG